MRTIQTVVGNISERELGFCQFHEHIFITKGVSSRINPVLCIDHVSKSCEEVARYRKHGGGSFIDAQPVGCNRSEESLVAIAQQTGVHILASTGFHKACFYEKNHWISNSSAPYLTEVFQRELTEGMFVGSECRLPKDQCNSRASIIKTALDRENLTSAYRTLFSAAVQAHKVTEAPMMIHIEKGSNPVELLSYLLSQGANPGKLVFCHMDRACEGTSEMIEVLKAGAYLELDTIGRFKYHNDMTEVRLIQKLIEEGFASHILCGLDTTRERLKAYNPSGVGLDYIFTTFVPLMKENKVKELDIKKIFFENPARILTT